MGGLGSGPRFGRLTVEGCRSLNVGRLHREGCLRAGWQGAWEWRLDGERTAWISMRTSQDMIHLAFRVRAAGEDWQSVEEDVAVMWEPCRFGGRRPYFLCPGAGHGQSCGRRVLKLYGAGVYFLCRHCHDLSYTSRNESDLDRAIRRADKAKMKLGGEVGMDAIIPGKPKGMWHRTYQRLHEEAVRAETIAHAQFLRVAEQIIAKTEVSG